MPYATSSAVEIDAEGGVLIMDVGIARSTSPRTAFGMTASGVILGGGTPAIACSGTAANSSPRFDGVQRT
jgi:hypothetical protein